MYKRLLSILALIIIMVGANIFTSYVEARPTKDDKPAIKNGSRKSLRNYRRAQQNAIDAISTTKMVKGRDYTYYPSTLISVSGPNAMAFNNRQLTTYYYVEISPSRLTVLLPVYGSSTRSIQPVVWKQLDFFTGNYTYNFVEEKDGKGWRVTIKAMDPWSTNTYTFEFTISNRSFAELSLSTPFVGPATFTGNVAN